MIIARGKRQGVAFFPQIYIECEVFSKVIGCVRRGEPVNFVKRDPREATTLRLEKSVFQKKIYTYTYVHICMYTCMYVCICTYIINIII